VPTTASHEANRSVFAPSNRVAALLLSISILSGACHSARPTSRFANSGNMNQIIETLRNAYAAFNRGDMDSAVAQMDSNIEWVEPLEFAGGGRRRGREAVKQYLLESRSGWAEGSSEPEGFVISNDNVVVFVRARFRLRNSSTWQEVKLADVYTVHDNNIVAMHAFVDRKEALRWANTTDELYKEAS